MGIKTIYQEKILEEVLREFLDAGTFPTADELLDAYTEVVGNRDMTKPLLTDQDNTVGEWAESSAAAYNAFFERVRSDLEVLYIDTWERYTDGMGSFDRWRLELDSLRKKLVNLDSRIDNLLLLRQDTAGYFAFVEDNFVDFTHIDQDNTGAKVDVANHTVTLSEDTATQSHLDLNTLPIANAVFVILTRNDLVSSQDTSSTNLTQAIADAGTFWQHRVRTSKLSNSVTGELKIKLGSLANTVSRIIIDIHSSNSNSPVVLVGQYSNDNHNWFNLPTNDYTQSTDSTATFIFEPTSMQWVKFTMTKTGPDNIEEGFYIYEFGMKSISFYDAGFSISSASTFRSLTQSAYDEDDTRIGFNKLALETCQTVPDETAIDYWVQASDGTETTDWLRIDPYNVSSPRAATILDLGQLNETELTDYLNVRKHGVGGDSAYSNTYFSQFKTITNRLALIGATVTVPTQLTGTTMTGLVWDSVKFYRNVGPRYGTTTLVRTAPMGWRYDSTKTYLLTTIIVQNPDGITIDFGKAGATLNGQPVYDSVLIPLGVHTFKTHIDNTGAVTAGQVTESGLEGIDPLYPYNHQKLIEGYEYSSTFDGAQFYVGVDLFCEHVARRVSIFDLINNAADDDYSRYALDSAYLDSTSSLVFVIRFDPDESDFTNERHNITYSVSNSMFDRVVLKAELSSDDATKTPVFAAYRIKLGV